MLRRHHQVEDLKHLTSDPETNLLISSLCLLSILDFPTEKIKNKNNLFKLINK
jgi:hypothetical protein